VIGNDLPLSFGKKSTDLGLLLTTNEIRALKDLVFSATRRTYQLQPLAHELRGYGMFEGSLDLANTSKPFAPRCIRGSTI